MDRNTGRIASWIGVLVTLLGLIAAAALTTCSGDPAEPEVPNLAGRWVEDVEHVTDARNWCGNPKVLASVVFELEDAVQDPAAWESVAVVLEHTQDRCTVAETGWTLTYPAGEYRPDGTTGLEFRWLGWDEGPEVAAWVGEPGGSLHFAVALNHSPITVTLTRVR